MMFTRTQQYAQVASEFRTALALIQIGGSAIDHKSMAGGAAVIIHQSPVRGFGWLMGPCPATFEFDGAPQLWRLLQGLALRLLDPTGGSWARGASGNWADHRPEARLQAIMSVTRSDVMALMIPAEGFGRVLRLTGILD